MNVEKKKVRTDVNFSFAFATPHRLCICQPEASRKCLLDATETGLTVSWSDGDLTTVPLGAFKPLPIAWWLDLRAEANGSALTGILWKRVDNRLPALEYRWEKDKVSVDLTAVSVDDADVFKIYTPNQGSVMAKVSIFGTMRRNLVFNQMWIDLDSDINALLPTMGDRSDRMLVLAVGAPKPLSLPSRDNIVIEWEIAPGKEKTAYLVRPHFAILDEAKKWLSRDWETEIKRGLEVWRNLLKRAPHFLLPDPLVADAYYAGLADIFVMREKQADGQIAGAPGTECYRSTNTCEPSLAAIVLDQAGFYKKSGDGMRLPLSFQEKNGRWDDLRRWGHDMWGLVGFKCFAIREHYLFTHDRKYLAECFGRMLAHARWSHKQRQKTKIIYKGEKPLTWGLMPRGMGDGGLMDGDDLYGIFFPHNIWHCFMLKVTLWAAQELGLKKEAKEAASYYEDALVCTLDSMKRGSIKESDGTRWIPGVPGKTCGSRWGVANVISPCGILEPNHPLADGTLKYLESNLSIGGLPINLGWMLGGLWVSIAIDNLAYAHLARGEEDEAVKYLYPTLNHGTPLFSWCEERLPEPGTQKITGDRQHAWTPISMARFVRDILLMEEGNVLHIARAVPRWWLEKGQEIKVENAPTHWGMVNYCLSRRNKDELFLELQFKEKTRPEQILLHGRIPEPGRTFTVQKLCGARASVENNKIIITPQSDFMTVRAKISINS